MKQVPLSRRCLQLGGLLLLVVGTVHLVATPHIPHLLRGMATRDYAMAVGPTLLNHVVVGILLLAVGFSTLAAASKSAAGQPWARFILAVNALAVAAMCVSVAALMRNPLYYTAPLFALAVVLLGLLALLMLVAAWGLRKGETKF